MTITNSFVQKFIGGAVAVLAVTFLLAGVASAAIQGSAGPNYPDPVTVGQVGLAASLSISNTSDGTNATHSVSVTSISTTPSCGSTINNPCQPADIDLGVFTVHNGVGRAATACAGIVFTAGAPDASGAVTFTPGSAVTLGPAGQCVIDFTIDVLKVPTKDNSGAAGIQTGILGKAIFQDQTTLDFGSGTGSSQTTVNKAGSNTVTEIHDANHGVVTAVSAGTQVHDKATVTPSNATGTVSFQLYSDASCEVTNGAPQVVALSGGTAETSAVAANSAMSYRATYSGDTNFNSSVGDCEPLTVNKLTSTVSTAIHNSAHGTITSANPGDTVHDSASVTGSGPTPTGNVTFDYWTNSTCSSTAADTSGTFALSGGSVDATTFAKVVSVGGASFKAHYAGDSVYNADDGDCEQLTVEKASPNISTTPSAGGDIGVVLNDTATLTGGNSPTGSVTFKLFPPSDATCSGTPVYTEVDPSAPYATSPGYTSLVAGTYRWTADYAGDANNNADSSGCQDEQVVVTQPSGEWCSPGYWRNHLDAWVATGISTSALYSAYFDPVVVTKKGQKDNAPANPTLLEVVQHPQWYGGEAFNNVGDLLSEAHPDVNFVEGGERVENCPLN
jgi:hypothetical protein